MKFTNLITLVALILLASCKRDMSDISPIEELKFLTEAEIEEMIQLGPQKENPYSVVNMKRAWENLMTTNENARTSSNDLAIETTHYYVKFDPKTEDELAILKLDSLIDLFEYPLDVDITEDGESYHDPSLPTNRPIYQYAAVEVEYDFPEGVDYEILEELFIPDENRDGEENSFARQASNAIVEDLVTEALRITNNLSDDASARKCGGSRRPAGTMMVWDTRVSGYIPVHDMEIKATRWFTTYKGKTNVNGYFSCDGTFSRDFNYSFKWEKYNFQLRKEGGGTPGLTKNNKCGDWDEFFGGTTAQTKNYVVGDHQLYATIFRAARYYYYAPKTEILNLRRPPQNATFNRQIQIRALNKPDPDGNSGYWDGGDQFLGMGTQIEIYNDDDVSSHIFGTTIHELAHASHWGMSDWHFNNSDRIVKETWARGVEITLSELSYPNYSRINGRRAYTGLVLDLMDDAGITKSSDFYYNSNLDKIYISRTYLDQVEGYTIRQIEDALKEKRTWQDWEQSIVNKYTNITKNNVDEAFDYWNTK